MEVSHCIGAIEQPFCTFFFYSNISMSAKESPLGGKGREEWGHVLPTKAIQRA